MARPTLAGLEKRVVTLAKRMGCCERHGTPLYCLCCAIWLGTPAEFAEVVALLDTLAPYRPPLIYTDQVCSGCQSERWCESCNRHAGPPLQIPDEVLSWAEWERYHQLCQLVRERTATDGPAVGIHPSWDAPPAPAPEPVASSMREPRRATEPVPEPPPEPIPEPAIVVEEDAAVDAEIQSILAQLQLRATDGQKGIAQHLKTLLGQCD